MNIEPMVDRVLIKREEVATSKGGVALPDSVQSADLIYGEVVALGLPRADYIRSSIDSEKNFKVGDRVAFVKYSAANITDGIDNYLIIRYDDILAIVNSDVKKS